MEEEQQPTGFTLFPLPPTPPAKRSRARTKSSSNSSAKLTKSRQGSESSQGQKSTTTSPGDTAQSGLLPAPLKIRKSNEDIPPLPTFPPPLAPPTPTRTAATLIPPKTPDQTVPRLPSIPSSAPISSLPQTPVRQSKVKSRIVTELIELEGCSKKRASARLSQWLDLEDGEIDRNRLSRYLGSVLDNQFEVPTFEARARASMALSRRVSRIELKALLESCECPPNTIICQCSSSPEFERFRNWSPHKANSSVSSTACLIGVPRARFQSAFFAITEPSIDEVPSSPPGLTFETEEEAAEASDWFGPLTPSKDDPFSGPTSGGNLRSIDYTIRSTQTWSWTPSKHQSFSRPFGSDSVSRSTSKSQASVDSSPSTPSRSQSRSTAPRSGFLTSISTMSSFDFDFDIKARRKSLDQLKEFNFETPPRTSEEVERPNHFRTESNNSVGSHASHASHYEVITATATAPIAMTSSDVKPVLITNTGKRHELASVEPQPKPKPSLSVSTKSSASAVSVPEYWHKYDSGMPVLSRSTTMASIITNESAAFSTMLTMPVVSQKLPELPKAPVPGNAFSQRPLLTIPVSPMEPSKAPGHSSPGVMRAPDTNYTPVSPQTARSPNATFSPVSPQAVRSPNATFSPISSQAVPSSQSLSPVSPEAAARSPRKNLSPISPVTMPSPGSDLRRFNPLAAHSPTVQHFAPTTTAPPAYGLSSPRVHEPVQAYTNASARLKAYMDNCVDSTSPVAAEGKIGLGLKKLSTRGRKKQYLYVEEQQTPYRDDSGVFGRMSVLGTALGVMPGRREFSEPHYYRT